MFNSLSTRLISLCLITLGGVLCYVPNQLQEHLTQYLYDALTPGVTHVKPYLLKTPQTVNLDNNLPPQVLLQCSLLWAENNRLKNLDLNLQNSPLRKLPMRESSPLLSAEMISANFLTVAQASRWQQELILQMNPQKTISKGDFVLSQTELLIDQGALAGISPQALLLTGAVVIGQITHVGLQTAKVKRIVDPEFRGSARLLRQSPQGPVWGALGSLHGTGASHCELDYIKLTDPVAEGDFVVAINPETKQFLGPVYGTVTSVIEQPGKSDWQIQVTPLSTADPLLLPVVHVLSEKLNNSRVMQVSHQQDEHFLNPVPTKNFPGSLP